MADDSLIANDSPRHSCLTDINTPLRLPRTPLHPTKSHNQPETGFRTETPSLRHKQPPKLNFPPPQTATASPKPAYTSARRHNSENGVQKRFMPRTNYQALHTSLTVPGALAEALGVRSSRVLDFSGEPALERKFAPANFVSQYAPFATPARPAPISRAYPTKPEKILDAPGFVDDFYLNLLDWAGPADTMAIGLGSVVYAWDPRTNTAYQAADIAASTRSNAGVLSEPSAHVTGVKWSPQDSCLAIATSNGHIQLWDPVKQKRLRTMKGRSRDRLASLSWNGHMLSAGGRSFGISNHDVRIRQHKVSEYRGHTGEVCGLAWRQDGQILASGGNDNTVFLWDVRSPSAAQHKMTQHQAAIKALAWCPWQNNLLASGGGSNDRQIMFWNANSGHLNHQLATNAQVNSLHWSEEYHEITATLGYPLNSIMIWNYADLTLKTMIERAHDERILAATLSSNGRMLATCSSDESLKLWDLFPTAPKAAPPRRGLAGIGRV